MSIKNACILKNTKLNTIHISMWLSIYGMLLQFNAIFFYQDCFIYSVCFNKHTKKVADYQKYFSKVIHEYKIQIKIYSNKE